MRTPSLTAATSSSAPLSVTESTEREMWSMKVDAPSVAVKRTSVVDRKTSSPVVTSSAIV
jgi:hypothetical protein